MGIFFSIIQMYGSTESKEMVILHYLMEDAKLFPKELHQLHVFNCNERVSFIIKLKKKKIFTSLLDLRFLIMCKVEHLFLGQFIYFFLCTLFSFIVFHMLQIYFPVLD